MKQIHRSNASRLICPYLQYHLIKCAIVEMTPIKILDDEIMRNNVVYGNTRNTAQKGKAVY